MSFYFSVHTMQFIKEHLPIYRGALETVGLSDPLILPCLHYRESEFSLTGEETGCGPFAFDPGDDGPGLAINILAAIENLCNRYDYAPREKDLDKDFHLACLMAAHEFKGKVKTSPCPASLSREELGETFWRYNGASKHHNENEQTGKGSLTPGWMWSPYVVNDPANGRTLRLKGTLPDGAGGRRAIDIPDKRPGALTVYDELTERWGELA